MRLFILALPVVFLVNCSLFGKRERLYEWGEPTPKGYRVEWKDRGTTAGGVMSKAGVFNAFDAAIVRGQLYLVNKYGALPQTAELYARSTKYTLIDDKRIATNASGTGFASGLTYGNSIMICLMSRREAPSKEEVPKDAPPWTIVDLGNGRFSYGVIDPDRPFPALGHELGHRLYGPAFEH